MQLRICQSVGHSTFEIGLSLFKMVVVGDDGGSCWSSSKRWSLSSSFADPSGYS